VGCVRLHGGYASDVCVRIGVVSGYVGLQHSWWGICRTLTLGVSSATCH